MAMPHATLQPQVGLLVPDAGNPSAGQVLALVHDSTDRQAAGSSVPFYVGSNGCVSELACANASTSTVSSVGAGLGPGEGSGAHASPKRMHPGA